MTRVNDANILLRLPREFHEAVVAAADANGMSVNAFIRICVSRQINVPLPPSGNRKRLRA